MSSPGCGVEYYKALLCVLSGPLFFFVLGEVEIFCWFKVINAAIFGPQFFMCRNTPVTFCFPWRGFCQSPGEYLKVSADLLQGGIIN